MFALLQLRDRRRRLDAADRLTLAALAASGDRKAITKATKALERE